MRQPHRNIFFFYRGAASRESVSDQLFETQLEDNTTKALIHVLEHSDRKRVLVPFLRRFAKIPVNQGSDAVQFALQKVDIARPDIPKKIALAIAPIGGFSRAHDERKKSGRPDAWIWLEDSFAVLIENKIRGQATLDQIERHIRTADGWQGRARKRNATWPEVFEFFAKQRRGSKHIDAVSKLLITEFMEYLKMTGIAASAKFEIDDFVYFTQKPEDRHAAQKDIVARKLDQFTEALGKTSVVRDIVSLYTKRRTRSGALVNPGVFRKTMNNYWITLGPKQRREHCHLTVRITEQGIRLDAFAPHKNYTRKMVNAIKTDPSRLLAALKHIPSKEGYFIRLREAYYSNPSSSYKGQRIGKSLDFLNIHPSALTSENVEILVVKPMLDRMKRKEMRPEIFLVREFPLSELLASVDAVELVSKAARKMVPYLKFALKAGE